MARGNQREAIFKDDLDHVKICTLTPFSPFSVAFSLHPFLRNT